MSSQKGFTTLVFITIVLLITAGTIALVYYLKNLEAPKPQATLQAVPSDRLNSLKRGVNISYWFGFPFENTDKYFANYIDDSDLQFIHDHDFTHIRLTIAPQFIYDKNSTSFINAHMLPFIDQAIQKILKHNLAVVVDIHDSDADKTFENDQEAKRFIVFWTNFASHLSSYDQDKVFFELLNEPVFEKNPQHWLELQGQLITAIRSVDNQHTIIATGAHWGSLGGLLQLTPYNDYNIIYSFHYYEPFEFTHQGAEWTSPEYIAIANLQYPYNEENCMSILNSASDSKEKDVLWSYCDQKWNKEKIGDQIKQAADWGKKYNVPIWIGEFGVYCKQSPRQSKLQWFKDIKEVFEQNHIGWALWAYDECFGLGAKKEKGKIIYDKEVMNIFSL